jgi:hypothetical protein
MKNYSKIKFYYHDEIDNVDKIERMWASKIGEYYKLENSPFYVLNFALGDIVSVKILDGEFFVDELIESSGNSTIQIVFYKEDIVTKTREELKKMGCNSEISNILTLISVNIPFNIDYNEIKHYLENGSKNDFWDYQEACLAHQTDID